MKPDSALPSQNKVMGWGSEVVAEMLRRFGIKNNRSYFTDEIQQDLVAKERKRPLENRWIGQRIDDPPVDLAGLARDYGVEAKGPIEKASDLVAALERGVKAIESGEPYLVDVLIDPTRGTAFDWLSGT